MKNLFAVLSILVLLLLVFTACGNEPAPPSSQKDAEKTELTDNKTNSTNSSQSPSDTAPQSSTPPQSSAPSDTDDKDNRPPVQETIIYSFQEYLDYMGFDENMWQRNLIDLLNQYSYNDKSVIGTGHFYDGVNGGGFAGSSEACSYLNDYFSDGVNARTVNHITTTAPLTGLTLPYGMTFNYSLEDALKATSPSYTGNLPQAGMNITVSLTNDGTLSLSKTEGNTALFLLKYEEKYQVALSDGRVSKVTRFIELTFDGESKKLVKFKICVEENYPLQKVIVNSLSEYLDYMEFDESMSQQQFDSFLEQFTYNRETIIKNFCHADGVGYSEYFGGGNFAYFKLCARDCDGYTEYTKQFIAKVPLTGLTLPYDIAFENTLEETLQVIGIASVDTLPEIGERNTLFTDDAGTVSLSKVESGAGVFYLLEYEEKYQVTSYNDKIDDVWRYIRFYFKEESKALTEFELCMVRHHPTGTAEPTY